MKRDIYRIAVIEAQAIMRRSLAEGANRQRATECSGKKLFNLRDIHERPRRPAVKTHEASRLAIPAHGKPRQAQELVAHGIFGERHVSFGEPALILVDYKHRLSQSMLRLQHVS